MIPIAKTILGKEEIDVVIKVLKSGHLREGSICRSFEEAFAKKVGAKYATTMANGTAALHAAYLYFIKPGNEVIVPTFNFIATASMVCWAGGRPVFCDIDPRTFCIDTNDLKRKVTRRTKAIAPVHLFGNACDIDSILKIARKYNLKIIWDAAQAHLTKYKGKDVGSFGNAVCYSFYATKNMTTGEGGMITSNNKDFIKKCILLKHQGQARKYYHTILGTNYRMTDIEAAIGLEQLKKLPEFTKKRQENAQYLTKYLSNLQEMITPEARSDADHSYHQYTVLLKLNKLSCNRDEFVSSLRNEGVAIGVNYPFPLHKMPVFRKSMRRQDLPNAEWVSQRCLSLPVHPYLKKKDLDCIIRAIKKTIYTFRKKYEKR